MEPNVPTPRPTRFVPGELVVKFRPGVSEERVEWILNLIGAQAVDSIATLRLYRVRISDPHKATEALAVLEGFAEVEYAEPNSLESQPAPQ